MLAEPTILPVPLQSEESSLALAIAELGDAAREYAEAARSYNTRRAYRADWMDFQTWCNRRGLTWLPALPETVALYISERAGSLKTSSIRRRLSSISQAHQEAGYDTPTAAAGVRQVWKGICNTNGTSQEGKAPAVAAEIVRMLDAVPTSILTSNPRARELLIARDRALLLLGFLGAFRRSELVALTTEDLRIGSSGMTVQIRRSKTDQAGEGQQLAILYQPDQRHCAIRCVKSWLKAASIESGPVFRAVDRHGRMGAAALAPHTVARVVKRTARLAGLDEERYSGHSLRAGLATSAAAAHADDRAIMRQTRHRDRKTLDKYVREASLFRDNVTGLVRI